MAINFEDINALALNDFGVPAAITQTGLSDKPVAVLFDANSINEMGLLTDKPQISVLETDLSGFDIRSATITINSIDYRMMKPLPDSHGFVVAGLQRI